MTFWNIIQSFQQTFWNNHQRAHSPHYLCPIVTSYININVNKDKTSNKVWSLEIEDLISFENLKQIKKGRKLYFTIQYTILLNFALLRPSLGALCFMFDKINKWVIYSQQVVLSLAKETSSITLWWKPASTPMVFKTKQHLLSSEPSTFNHTSPGGE